MLFALIILKSNLTSNFNIICNQSILQGKVKRIQEFLIFRLNEIEEPMRIWWSLERFRPSRFMCLHFVKTAESGGADTTLFEVGDSRFGLCHCVYNDVA